MPQIEIFPTMDPFSVCDILTNHVKMSGLNFVMTESPFNINIQIKKSFIKMKDGSLKFPLISKFTQQENYSSLVEENNSLKHAVAQFESEHDSLKETLDELHIKLQKSKVDISALLSDKDELVKAREAFENGFNKKTLEYDKLKESYKLLKEEKEVKQKEMKKLSNVLKNKDKEVHNLTVKNENLVHNLSNAKQEKNELLSQKSKALKDLAKLERKLKKSPKVTNMSTNTSTTFTFQILPNLDENQNQNTNKITSSCKTNKVILDQKKEAHTSPTPDLSLPTVTPESSNISETFSMFDATLLALDNSNDETYEGPCDQNQFTYDKFGYGTNSRKNFNFHRSLEIRLEEIIHESEMMLKDVPVEELIFTAEELIIFGLDWKNFEEISELVKNITHNDTM